MTRVSIVKERQAPLTDAYTHDSKNAWITDVAIIEGKNFDDPFHTSVSINDELMVNFKIGVHRAVGGHHDHPNSGDILCASLASCFETVLRMVANRMYIKLEMTKVKATANVDVRGTLMIDKTVPVAFQSMGLDIEIKADELVPKKKIQILLSATEQSCIVFQTLKKGIPIVIKSTIL